MSTDTQATEASSAPRWRPLSAIERRVLGVLIEKAKTTPENYPLSLNALRTGCNQKSNRAPMMQLEDDQVAEALESLRQSGAVAEIQGGARVDKYRHLAYEWLGVDKVELAVMAELLLRGTQTVGELRGRAARMEPIKDLPQLQPVLDSLLAKRLIVRLTPAGRGCVVTHELYLDHEKEKVRREASSLQVDELPAESSQSLGGWGREGTAAKPWSTSPQSDEALSARPELDPRHPTTDSKLADEVRRIRDELAALRSEFESTTTQLRGELDELNRQLGN
jgi:uncharacterized protein